MVTITITVRQVDELTDLRELAQAIDRLEEIYGRCPEAKNNWELAVGCLRSAGAIMENKETSANRARDMRRNAWGFLGRAEIAYKKFRQKEQLSQQNPNNN